VTGLFFLIIFFYVLGNRILISWDRRFSVRLSGAENESWNESQQPEWWYPGNPPDEKWGRADGEQGNEMKEKRRKKNNRIRKKEKSNPAKQKDETEKDGANRVEQTVKDGPSINPRHPYSLLLISSRVGLGTVGYSILCPEDRGSQARPGPACSQVPPDVGCEARCAYSLHGRCDKGQGDGMENGGRQSGVGLLGERSPIVGLTEFNRQTTCELDVTTVSGWMDTWMIWE
jgi:hypothetical protein